MLNYSFVEKKVSLFVRRLIGGVKLRTNRHNKTKRVSCWLRNPHHHHHHQQQPKRRYAINGVRITFLLLFNYRCDDDVSSFLLESVSNRQLLGLRMKRTRRYPRDAARAYPRQFMKHNATGHIGIAPFQIQNIFYERAELKLWRVSRCCPMGNGIWR